MQPAKNQRIKDHVEKPHEARSNLSDASSKLHLVSKYYLFHSVFCIKLEAIATLEAIAIGLEAVACRPEAIASSFHHSVITVFNPEPHTLAASRPAAMTTATTFSTFSEFHKVCPFMLVVHHQ